MQILGYLLGINIGKAVSYTHLSFSRVTGKQFLIDVFYHTVLAADLLTDLNTCHAVSYTHLDVYKRQELQYLGT